jgi:hypothetical protein
MDQSNSANPTAEAKAFSWKAYGKGQVDYWRAFVHDLVLGTIKRIIFSPFLFGLAFIAVAFAIYRLGIKTQETYSFLMYFQAVLLFPIYIVAGVVCGLLYGLTSSVFKKIDELEQGIHLIVEPVMMATISKIPGGTRGVSLDTFNSIFNTQIGEFKAASKSAFRWLSVGRIVSNFLVRNSLKALRYAVAKDFVAWMEKKGETRITANALESYTREYLTGSVANAVRSRFRVLRYTVYGLPILFIAVPLIIWGLSATAF